MIWPTRQPGNPKPHIMLNMEGLYFCHDTAQCRSGWGKTPQEAYADWQLRDSKRFTIKRAGIWNKKSCMDWFRSGCPPVNSWLGNRQFVSYQPATDTLVLRGAS